MACRCTATMVLIPTIFPSLCFQNAFETSLQLGQTGLYLFFHYLQFLISVIISVLIVKIPYDCFSVFPNIHQSINGYKKSTTHFSDASAAFGKTLLCRTLSFCFFPIACNFCYSIYVTYLETMNATTIIL